MNNKDKCEEFSFWKYPWQKWFVLVAALSQILCLRGNILDYKEYRKMFGYGIFGAAELANYALQRNWSCAINALLIVILLGTLLVGVFARNHKKAWLMEGLFLLVLAFVWGTVCFAFRLFPSNTRVKAAFFLLMFLGGAAYNLYRFTKGG